MDLLKVRHRCAAPKKCRRSRGTRARIWWKQVRKMLDKKGRFVL